MLVPGGNILNQAFSLIARQKLIYLKYVSRTQNAVKQYVSVYADPVTVYGSLQPVPRNLMQILGLDFEKSYVNIYVSQSVMDIQRDVSSDIFQYDCETYKVLSVTPWANVDGWMQVLAVKVPSVANA